MTTPVETDDLVQAAVKHLMTKPEILAVLGTYEGTNIPYLFQRKLWVPMEGTSSTALLVYSDGGWSTANLHNTLRFPRLSLELYTDPLRDHENNVTDPGEVWRRANHAYRVIDRVLHHAQGGEQQWGSMRIVDCVRMAEPTHYETPDGDGLLRTLFSYAVTEG